MMEEEEEDFISILVIRVTKYKYNYDCIIFSFNKVRVAPGNQTSIGLQLLHGPLALHMEEGKKGFTHDVEVSHVTVYHQISKGKV